MSSSFDHTLAERWPEIIGISLLVIGFLFALTIGSPFLNYILSLLTGALAGRILYKKYHTQPIFPFILITIGFLLGFMLGAIKSNRILITILFIAGAYISYRAHKEGYLEYFRSRGFIH